VLVGVVTRSRLRTVVVLAAVGLAAAACVSLSGLSGGEPPGADAGDGAVEAAPIDAARPDPCSHATYPAPPAKDDDPATEKTVVVALRSVSISGGIGDAGATPGFDLDGVCSCFPDPTTAHEGKASCIGPDGSAPACDADGGGDRQLGSLLAGYPDFFSGNAAENGGSTLVMKMTKYNGRSNDAEVFVGVFASAGIYEVRPACAPAPSGAPPYKPTWTGCDRWTIDSRYTLPGTAEPTVYLRGYVTDHVLVVPPSSKPVAFLAGTVTLPISAALLWARLVAVDAKLAPISPAPEAGDLFRVADGVVAGRVTTTDALRGFASQQASTDGGPLCGFPNFFDAIKASFVCPNADIAASPGNDFAGLPCDAISVAAAFSAEPAQLGDVRDPAASPCADPNDPKYNAFFDCSK
jgi:hypothetical protein